MLSAGKPSEDEAASPRTERNPIWWVILAIVSVLLILPFVSYVKPPFPGFKVPDEFWWVSGLWGTVALAVLIFLWNKRRCWTPFTGAVVGVTLGVAGVFIVWWYILGDAVKVNQSILWAVTITAPCASLVMWALLKKSYYSTLSWVMVCIGFQLTRTLQVDCDSFSCCPAVLHLAILVGIFLGLCLIYKGPLAEEQKRAIREWCHAWVEPGKEGGVSELINEVIPVDLWVISEKGGLRSVAELIELLGCKDKTHTETSTGQQKEHLTSLNAVLESPSKTRLLATASISFLLVLANAFVILEWAGK